MVKKNKSARPGLGIRVQPADWVYVYENHSAGGVGRGLYTAVIQNIAFVNESDETVKLETAALEVRSGDQLVQSHTSDQEELRQAARKFQAYQEQGILDAYDFQFQTSRYLKGVSLASDTELAPGQALVLTRKTLLFQGLPDSVTIAINGLGAGGKAISAEHGLRVANHGSMNEYHFPVKGRWLVAGAPSLHSHHRWGTLQEFALDLAQVGAGGLSHSGDGSRLSQFYAYGQPVFAIGDGVVVSTRGDMEEANSNLQQPGEDAEAYFERMLGYQQSLLVQGFSYTAGNHVAIQHPHGEYSRYVHLQHNSLRVAVGDRVARGQQIANLGHSGNSTEPHLHFDLADGPDLAYSRSIPMAFTNLTLWPDDDGTVRHLHLGQVVVA